MKSDFMAGLCVLISFFSLTAAYATPGDLQEAGLDLLVSNAARGAHELIRVQTTRGQRLVEVPVRIQQVNPTEVRLQPIEESPENYVVTWGVRFTTPQIVSASFGIIIAPESWVLNGCTRHGEVVRDFCRGAGFLLQVEPGLGGGAINAGFAMSFGSRVSGASGDSWVGRYFNAVPLIGAALKATLYETWGPTFENLEAGQTYLGFQMDLDLFLKFSGGYLWRIIGQAADQDGIFTFGLGFGF